MSNMTEKEYHQKWIQAILPTRLGQPIDMEVAKANIPKMYAIFADLLKEMRVSKNPTLVIADSPRNARLKYDLLREAWEEGGREDDGDYLKMVPVLDEIIASGKRPKKPTTNNMMSAFMGIQDYDWFGSYEKWCESNPPVESFEILKLLSQANIFNCIICTHVCIMTCMPERLTINEEFQLDCADLQPTMVWNSKGSYVDGSGVQGERWAYAYWRNTQIPVEWIENPENITKEVILSEQNAEKKRIAVEIIGAEKFAAMFDLELIDSHEEEGCEAVFDLDEVRENVPGDISDEQIRHMASKLGPDGKDTLLEYIYGCQRKFTGLKDVKKRYELYRSKDILDPIVNEKAQFLKVICPSTDRVYYLGVPLNVTTSKEAVNYLWQDVPEYEKTMTLQET